MIFAHDGPRSRYTRSVAPPPSGREETNIVIAGTSDTRVTVIPAMRYQDAAPAIDWLCEAFGFERHLVVPEEGGRIAHAQLVYGNGMIMLGSMREETSVSPTDLSPLQGQYVIVDDVDAHCARAAAAGATIVDEPADQEQGGRLYSCRDPEGFLWHFGSYDPWASE